jgi:hypothetical protein
MKKSILAIFLWFLSSYFLLAQNKKPNVLIILTDDLGYHDVSYYDNKDLSTPNIDHLRRDG